ncbi:TIGR03619 family F420-dependent LLM class oxidoreductase [Myxococcota bacterium]|nr:TIGR03619 family F420-dependent LLM class oxidoreductase [Myxococcota bacterium]
MEFGLGFPCMNLYPPTLQPWEATATGADIVTIAQKAESVGFSYLSVSDHVVMSSEMNEAMGARWCEGVTAIAFLAGATKRIRVYNSVMVLPYRNPLLVAKQLATLDLMSDGRAILGVGIGHLEKEFEVLGVAHADRGPLTDEYLQAINSLWTQEEPSFDGCFASFDGIVFEPKPSRVPIWIGGNSPAAIARAARSGDGWVPWKITTDDLPALLDELRRQPGYDDRPFDIVMPMMIIQREEGTQRILGQTIIPDGRDQWLKAANANHRAGATVTSVSLGHTRSIQEYLDKLESFGSEVIPQFR